MLSPSDGDSDSFGYCFPNPCLIYPNCDTCNPTWGICSVCLGGYNLKYDGTCQALPAQPIWTNGTAAFGVMTNADGSAMPMATSMVTTS